MTGDAFYEWLLSDHPEARAERAARLTASHQHQRDNAVQVRAWADKIGAAPDASLNLQHLAGSMGPAADKTLARIAEAEAEPDEVFVALERARHEIFMRAGQPDYRYPVHLTGPGAARYPRPAEPEAGQ